ncbi:hypothetical protein FWG86_01240 [Candidatus Saccharibacteria bacterium]|nr:hypothetical protein [Candidatus Saccharibacteria bacterium]
MVEFDEKFLAENGLDGLPHKAEFLAHLAEEHETRVGEAIAEGLPKDIVDQFDGIVAGDLAVISDFLTKNDYKNDPLYTQMAEKLQLAPDSPELNDEYASVKWLITNRPDYDAVIAKVGETIKQEVLANRDQLLAGSHQLPSSSSPQA